VSSNFRSGARVNKGDLLFAIEPSDYELAIKRTLADIEIAKSDLVRLEAEATSEKQIWLSSHPRGEIPDLIARIPQIAAAKARIRAGEAARETAKLLLQRTKVYAPFNARVINTQLDLGQVVSATASVGSIYAIENLEVVVPISSDDLRRIGNPVGRMAIITSDFMTDQEHVGQVVRQGATLDEFTRLGKLFIRTEANERLTSGEFVSVVVKADSVDSALAIPQSSLRSRDQVWVVDAGALSERHVQILGQKQDLLIVHAFDTADGVVTTPPAGAREGQQVKVRPSTRRAMSEVPDA
jgi:RND family efflux transporter MFP subunit